MLESDGAGGLVMGELEFLQYEPLLDVDFDTMAEAEAHIRKHMYTPYGVKTQILPGANGKFIIWYAA